MSLIAQCMPEFSVREIQRIAVQADPELAYLRARAIDFDEVGFVRKLRRWQSMPSRVRAWWRGYRRAPLTTARIDDLVERIPGVSILAERGGEEVVLAAIGKLWMPGCPLEPLGPGAFQGFTQPGFGKLALALRVSPRSFGGSWITIELRALGTDASAEARLRRAWHIAGRVGAAFATQLLQRLAGDLGPWVEDEQLRLPGDALLQDVPFQTTHAMTIEASPSQVWTWLLGTGASGSRLGSLLHAARSGARETDPPAIGERMPGLSGTWRGGAVVRSEPGRLLVLGDASLLPTPGHRPGWAPSIWSTTWAFVLSPIGDDATRLVVRVRSRTEHSLGIALLEPLVAALHDSLERRQLETVCRQAQSFDRTCAA